MTCVLGAMSVNLCLDPNFFVFNEDAVFMINTAKRPKKSVGFWRVAIRFRSELDNYMGYSKCDYRVLKLAKMGF